MKWHLPIWYLLLCLSGIGATYAQDSRALLEQRQTFQSAFKALKAKQYTRYHQLHRQLDDYPLRPYLTYRYLRMQLNKSSAKTIEQFLTQNDDTFYAQRLRIAWLSLLAKRKDWQTYLSFYRDTGSAELQCYQLHALAAIGQQDKAFERVPDMWLVPHSQNKACNDIFQQWQQAGHLTQRLRQQRFELAIKERQFSMAKFIAKSSDKPEWLLAQVERWQTMQSNPLSLLKQLPAAAPAQKTRFTLARDTEETRPIIVYGLSRLARQNPHKAFETWQRLKDHYHFSHEDTQTVHNAMGLWAALNRDEKALTYFDEAQGHEWHARAALWQRDWQTL
jgi:soluble lytic murein transglycosylase